MPNLTSDELELAQNLIDDRAPGEYEVEEIYGEFWDAIPNHTVFGRSFKRAAISGQLSRIIWVGRSSKNHQRYLLHGD